MKFKNLETGTIIQVNKKDKDRIERFKGYPDKFELVEDNKSEKDLENNKELEPEKEPEVNAENDNKDEGNKSEKNEVLEKDKSNADLNK